MYSGKPEIPEADDEHVVESEASGELGQNSQEHLSIEVKIRNSDMAQIASGLLYSIESQCT